MAHCVAARPRSAGERGWFWSGEAVSTLLARQVAPRGVVHVTVLRLGAGPRSGLGVFAEWRKAEWVFLAT